MDKSNLEEIKVFLAAHPVFSKLNKDEINAIVNVCELVEFKASDIICRKGEVVDTIYLILSGELKVVDNDANNKISLAILSIGEFVGLSTRSFFSSTGLRTADVIAAKDTKLAKISLDKINTVLKVSNINELFKSFTDLFLKIDFIKNSLPFKNVSNEKLKEYAALIEEIRYQADEKIFEEGELGEFCYLIKEGKVGISVKTNAHTKEIAQLEKGALFGESALLLDLPRNASAYSLSNTTLFKMSKALLMELIGNSSKTKENIFSLQSYRLRPRKIENIDEFERRDDTGELILTLRNNTNHQYFLIPEKGAYIWDQLDGLTSIYDLTNKFYQQYGIFAPQLINKLLNDLYAAGFIQVDTVYESAAESKLPNWMYFFLRLKKMMEIKFPIKNIDEMITTSYNRFVWLFFTKPSFIILNALGILGLITFFIKLEPSIQQLALSKHKLELLILVAIATIWTSIPHELAHAYTTKYFGRRVYYFGAGWIWIMPYAYCDTSDMWLNKSRDRVFVDLSGPYSNLLIGSLSALLILFLPAHAQVFLWLFALFNYLISFSNLNPMLRLDGYYTLMDLMNTHNLRESSIQYIIEIFKNPTNIIKLTRSHRAEFCYWIVIICYLIVSFIVNYFVSYYLLRGLFSLSSHLYSIIISLSVILLTSISFWVEFRENKSKQNYF